MQKKNGLSVFKTTKKLTFAAMLTAISVIIGFFCKTYLNFGAGLFRITFENLPIILSGILFGPIIGALVGISTDVISYFLSPQPQPINPLITAAAALVGIISGVIAKYVIKKRGTAQIIVAGGLSHIISSMIIKSAALYVFYGWAVLWRIPIYAVVAPVEILIICLLFKNKAFRSLLNDM